MAKKDKPTPDNTPLPGGGSWRWDDALPGWVSNDAYVPPQDSAPAPDAAVPEATPGSAS